VDAEIETFEIQLVRPDQPFLCEFSFNRISEAIVFFLSFFLSLSPFFLKACMDAKKSLMPFSEFDFIVF
jgi:hypothetical protein